MENDAATLCCPNESCQAANPLTHKFCDQCRTPLPKRYLWAVGDDLSVGSLGEILADRYLVISKSVVLDTRPGLLPQAPEFENLKDIRAYLRLIPYRLHVPQVYGVLPLTDGHSPKQILLLEKPPLFTDSATPQQVYLCKKLTDAWHEATSMRQLNWLWQVAHLWQPFKTEGVVSSLLEPHLLRLEGPLVRLLELRFDSSTAPGLPELGEFWHQLLSGAKPAIAEFVKEISSSLIQGEINSPEILIAVLDRGLAELGQSQTPSIQIITKTDTGPSRQRNEDSCYPTSGTLVSKPPQPSALAIVCDGIGGHEGGNVASNLAIETIYQQLQELTKLAYDHIKPSILLEDLESAVAVANDKISQRNDSEKRQGRQRMGTTVVVALPVAHEMYITHVGDSRAYWITHQGCYQVTLDDDVASREVRLGYAVYREAVQQGGGGSLVQAVGMSPSTSLHPTAQRFLLDEDAIFLLTTDGLSDFDRVEDYWETEILPILNGESDVVKVADRLVEIANTKNGHDNVTIALIHYQVKYLEPDLILKAVIPDISTIKTASKPIPATLLHDSPNQKNQVIPENLSHKVPQLPLGLIVPLVFVVAAGLIGYWVKNQGWLSGLVSPLPSQSSTLPPNINNSPEKRSLDNLAPGWVIQTKSELTLKNKEKLDPGSALQVIEFKPNSQTVYLRLCSSEGVVPANGDKPAASPLQVVEKKLLIELSELKRIGVSVLPSGGENSCTVSPADNLPPVPNAQSDTN